MKNIKNIGKNYIMFMGLIIIIILLIRVGNYPEIIYAETNTWDGSIATSFAGGSGTKNDPYQIATGGQLALIAKYVNDDVSGYNTAYYKLINNIILNNTHNFSRYKSNSKWNEIYVWHEFDGVFDGNGYKISGSVTSYGLFESVYRGVIRNVTMVKSYGTIVETLGCEGIVENCNKVEGESGIVGENEGLVKNCSNTGNMNGAGIVSCNYGIIQNCKNFADIKVNNKDGVAGGIVADQRGGEINNCCNKGNISVGRCQYIGGLVGNVSNGKVKACINKGKIIIVSKGSNIGGIIGTFNHGEISDCYNEGNITLGKGCSYIGGIVGEADCYGRNYTTITDCRNKGKISGKTKCSDIGGIAGDYNGKVYNCVNQGDIKIAGDVLYAGGIIGETSNAKIVNCANCCNINIKDGDWVGGIVGCLGSMGTLIYGDNGQLEDVKATAKVINCLNMGYINADNYAGGITGDTYCKIFNSYSVGKMIQIGTSEIAGTDRYKNKTAVNCYYLKGCLNTSVKAYHTDLGTELTKKQMQSKILSQKLNAWVKKQNNKVYSYWCYPSKKINNGYPYPNAIKKFLTDK